MAQTIDLKDLEKIPFPYLGTLSAYLIGIDVKAQMGSTAYYAHKKRLAEYGFYLKPNSRLEPAAVRKITLTEETMLDLEKHQVA